MFGRCLEGVWKKSGGLMEGAWKVSGIRTLTPHLPNFYQKERSYVTGGVSKLSGRCVKGV